MEKDFIWYFIDVCTGREVSICSGLASRWSPVIPLAVICVTVRLD